LQHTATHCNTLQHTATHCNTLQHTATYCNTLQHTATYCNILQHTEHTATHLFKKAINSLNVVNQIVARVDEKTRDDTVELAMRRPLGGRNNGVQPHKVAWVVCVCVRIKENYHAIALGMRRLFGGEK